MFFLLAEIFANCRVYNFFHSSLHKFPWQLKTIRSLGKGELELDEKKKQFQFQFRRKEKTIRNFNYSTKFFPLNPRSKISASTWCHSSQFFFKKKKRIQNCKLTSRKKNEKRFVFAEFSKDSSHSSLPAMQHRPTKAGLVSGFNDDRDWVTIGGHETCK